MRREHNAPKAKEEDKVFQEKRESLALPMLLMG